MGVFQFKMLWKTSGLKSDRVTERRRKLRSDELYNLYSTLMLLLSVKQLKTRRERDTLKLVRHLMLQSILKKLLASQ